MFNEICDFSPADFCGTTRLFPLPDLVFFPHVMYPLHIFEPRYREMLEEALSTDQLIGMSLLAPGWEKDYEQRPKVEPVLCLGRVLSHSKLVDGRYNILLAGVHRAKLVRELPAKRPFREFEATLIEDHYGKKNTTQRAILKRQLIEKLRERWPKQAPSGHLEEILAPDTPLGVLTDVLSFALPLGVPMKQQLLSEPDVDSRARILVRGIEELGCSEAQRSFPPSFSVN